MITDEDRDKAARIVEATWADFMQAQNTPFYRPTAELWATMACMVLSGINCERRESNARAVAAVAEEREACAKIADKHEREESKRAGESRSGGKGLSELGHVFEATAARAVADKIRARSQSEGGER